MKRPFVALRNILMVAMLALGLAACATPTGPIATITNVNGEAFLTRAAGGEVAAKPGDVLLQGDGFRTLNGTMLLTTTAHGGTIEVYDHTDPIVEEALCFAISFFKKGRMRVVGSGFCVNGVYQESDVGYEIIGPDAMRVWVLEGHVRKNILSQESITAGNRADIVNGAIINRAPFTPPEFEARFPPVPNAPQEPIIR